MSSLSCRSSIYMALAVALVAAVSAGAELHRVYGRVDPTPGVEKEKIRIDARPLADFAGRARTAQLDGAGYFDLGLEEGFWELELSWADGLGRSLRIGVFEPTTLPTLTTEAEIGAPLTDDTVVIAGQVRRGFAAEQVVEGAWVWLEGLEEQGVRSGRDGRYRLSAPANGTFVLRAAENDHAIPALPVETGQVGVAGPRPVLVPTGAIVGRVVDQDHRPVPAEIRISPSKPTLHRRYDLPVEISTYTDGGGRFEVHSLIRDELYETRFEAPGTIPREVRVMARSPGASAPLEVVLAGIARVSGTILDPEGLPVGGAEVVFLAEERSEDLLELLAGRRRVAETASVLQTDSRGAFDSGRLVAAGRYVLVITAEGFAPQVVRGIEAGASRPLELSPIHLSYAATVSGWVVGSGGEPVEGAIVRPSLLATGSERGVARSGPPARTDASGRFVVAGFVAGQQLELVVDHREFVPRTARARAPAEALTIALEPAATVSGRVLGSDGDPVEGARVRARPDGMDGSPLRRLAARGGADTEAVTDGTGEFVLHQLEPGRMMLHVAAECCPPATRRVRLEAGHRIDDLEVVLEPGTTLTGVVRDVDGARVRNALISAGGKSCETDARGQCSIQGLPPGHMAVSIRHEGYGGRRSLVELPSKSPVSLAFDEPAMLNVDVRDGTGRPVSGAHVLLVGSELVGSAKRQSDSTGRVGWTVQPGRFTVKALGGGRTGVDSKAVMLGAGEEAELTLVVSGEGATIRGTIVGATSAELTGAAVRAVATTGQRRRGRLGTNGTYSLEELEAGSWIVVLELLDGRRAQGEIELDDEGRDAHLDLEVGAGDRLRGALTLNGAPLEGAALYVSSLEGAPLAQTVTGVDGSFEVRGLKGDRVQVDLVTPEGDLRTSWTAELGVGPGLEVHLRTGRLSGTVFDRSTGRALDGVTLAVEPIGSSHLLGRRLVTGDDGHFAIARLVEGSYRLTCRRPGYLPAVAYVSIRAGAERSLDLHLAPTD